MPQLILKVNNKVVKEIVLSKDHFSIGRLSDNDLELNDHLVSRHHSKIIKDGPIYIIQDLDSANGVYVNKKKIKSEKLKEGDEIQIGHALIVFKEKSAFDMPPAPQPGPRSVCSSDIVKSVGELSIDYRLNVKDILAKGESLTAAVKPIAKSKTEERFFILYQLGKAVTSATILDEIFDIAMGSIFDFIKCDRGVIMVIDKNSGKLEYRLTKLRGKKGKNEEVYVSQTITNKVINDKVGLITCDAGNDPRFQAGLSIAQFNIRSALCVPLWEQDDIFGVLYVDNLAQTYAFTEDDLQLLTAIANQIAIRIKQDELYESLKKEALVRTNLERYHSPDVVELIIKQSANKSEEMDVIEKEVTILFADIQNFTTISETVTPRQIAEMLNEFFETTTQIVFEYKGSINKYIGDALLAVFGAPFDLPNHASNAVKAGVKMIKAIQDLQEKMPLDFPKYHLRVGINTGVVVAGNVGAKKRIEYAVLGDTVNIASRLNQFAESNQTVIGEATYNAIKNEIHAIPLGGVKLKGKQNEVQVYKVDDIKEPDHKASNTSNK
jgi:adenylate cyclase